MVLGMALVALSLGAVQGLIQPVGAWHRGRRKFLLHRSRLSAMRAASGPGPAAPRLPPLRPAPEAGVAELVDALGLGSSGESCGGSSPSARTRDSGRPGPYRHSLGSSASSRSGLAQDKKAVTTMQIIETEPMA